MKLSNEVKIALTAIAAVALLFVGINFLKGINVFESSNSYYVKFKDIRGLAVSNAVYANGYPVGIVREIDYNYSTNSSIVVRIELDEGMRVPRGTTAELETALMGGVTMSLLLGPNPSDNLAPHDTLTGGPKIGAMDQASAMIPDVQRMIPDVQRMIPKLDSILGTLNRITADPALLQSLHNVATISENLKTTTAQLDRLMAREVPQMVGHLNRTSAHAEQISSDLAQAKVGETVHKANETLASVQQLSTQLHSIMTEVQTKMNSRDNNLGAFLGDRLLYDRLSRTVQSADSLVIDLKNNPKRYVHFSIFGRK